MKRARQAEILSIIQSQAVETQEQLLQALRSRGFTSTQATISRDIKELHLVKELSGGCYRYTAYACYRRQTGIIINNCLCILSTGENNHIPFSFCINLQLSGCRDG